MSSKLKIRKNLKNRFKITIRDIKKNSSLKRFIGCRQIGVFKALSKGILKKASLSVAISEPQNKKANECLRPLASKGAKKSPTADE